MPAPAHVEVTCRLALQFLAVVPEIAASFRLQPGDLFLRVGINSGPVIGGIIGRLLPRYRYARSFQV